MKIIEVRDGFVKIESTEKVDISSFLELRGLEKKYVAQVIRSKNNGAGYNVYAKLLFIYDGTLRKYDKTMPDAAAEVSVFPFDVVNNSFNYFNPIVVGKFVSDNSDILLDSAKFNGSTLISIDNPETTDIVIQNLAKQYKQFGKTVVIDMLGVLNGEKYVAGRDFKLPLNTESLKFIYEDCLNDATADSKSMIKDIFADLVEYSKNVQFLPFTTLKAIIDDMVEKSHIFKLLILKNKLAKFEAAGYFATHVADSENLGKILSKDFAIIDLSKIDGLFQNRYLSVILSELEAQKCDATVFVEASNSINKKNIKTLLYSEEIKSVFATHSKFKYLAEIKSLFKNFILENTHTNKNIFSLYSFFIESMNQSNYLIVGEGTNFVPLVSLVEKYEVVVKKLPQDSISEEVIDTEYDTQVTENTEEFSEENLTEQETELSEAEAEVVASEPETELLEVEEETVPETELSEQSVSVFDLDDEEEPESSNTIPEYDKDEEAESDEAEPLAEDTETDKHENYETVSHKGIMEYEAPAEDVQLVEENSEDELTEQEEPEKEEDEEEEVLSLEESEDVEVPEVLEGEFKEIEQEEIPIQDSLEPEKITSDEDDQYSEMPVIPLDNQDSELGEFEEIVDTDENDENILVDLTEEEESLLSEINLVEDDSAEEVVPSKSVDEDIAEDVDKVFTTLKDESISDSDLDFIDTLNETDLEENLSDDNEFFSEGDAETLQELADEDGEEEGFLEPLEEISDSAPSEEPEKEILETRESSTPVVPIYDAEIPDEDKVISDDIEQGDTVVHAKYGSGVVEKMIKYGNKNLYSINFDNVGRRLLDPTLTEIKKA